MLARTELSSGLHDERAGASSVYGQFRDCEKPPDSCWIDESPYVGAVQFMALRFSGVAGVGKRSTPSPPLRILSSSSGRLA